MASNLESNLVKTEEDQKLLLLHTVSKKVIEMTRDLPGLDILDFNVNKTSRKVTLSIGYKASKPQKTLDLTEVLDFDNMGPRNSMATHKDFQLPDCEIHNKECPFSKHQDTYPDTEKPKGRGLLNNRPEFREELLSPGLEMMQREIVKIVTDYHHKDSHKTKDYETEEEDKTPKWFDTFINTNVEQMDSDYFKSLLAQRAADPDNAVILRRIDNFLSNSSRDNIGVDENGYREFIPGQPWLSQAETRRRDLDTAMEGIESAIQKHKTNAYTIVYDILKQAKSFETEGRNMATEIQRARRDDAKAEARKHRHNSRQETQDRRNRENLKTQFATDDQVEDDCNDLLEKAFTEINKKIQKFEERKELYNSKKEKEVNKTEGLNTGMSYGSSMFQY